MNSMVRWPRDQAALGFLDFAAEVGNRAADCGNLHESRLGGMRDNACDGGLARACGPEQDDAREVVVLDRLAKPAFGTDRLGLAHQLVKGTRPHAHRKGSYAVLRLGFDFAE